MSEKDTDELEVFYEDDSVVFNYDNFVIEFDSGKKTWVAISDDPELDEDIIIQDEETPFEEMDVFGYLLTEEEFKGLEKTVKETLGE